jgi:hypothetical protein
MGAAIACAVLALRSGLSLRRARQRGSHLWEVRQRHLWWARLAVGGVALGFVGGVASMIWLRGRDPFATLHGAVAIAALILFAAAGTLGWRLEHGAPASREVHALVATLAVLSAGLAFATGWVLLP